MLTPEQVSAYTKAGHITAQVRDYGATLIKPGAPILAVCKQIEEKIHALGGKPAFPVQISLNHTAAHFCPDPDDTSVFKEGDVCKLDVGVHVDGYIGDTAITVDLGNNKELIKASREACDAAMKLVAPGVTVHALGKVIQEVITSHGFSPIQNLGGHGLGQYVIHDHAISVPNYANNDKTVLREGMVIAIEPFATTGVGIVHETNAGNIYSHIAKKPVRNPYARKVQDEVAKYHGLPFTTHWLSLPQKAAEMGLRELSAVGAVEAHPPLVESKHGLVSQHEHTVIVGEKSIVTTKS
jgi:methionyl aminopeptidase